MNKKEMFTYGLGIIIGLVTSFQGYVVNDLHNELTYIRKQRDAQTVIYNEKFSKIETNYLTMKSHDRDMRRVEDGIKDLSNKVYLWKREE